MADPATEKLQNMNIQDFDGSEFDPYSSQNKMANFPNSSEGVDLLGDAMPGVDNSVELTNGHGKCVSFDHEVGIGLPDPSYMGASSRNMQRNMSEGEILGYQNEYGESTSVLTGQTEYMGGSDEEDDDPNNLIEINESQHNSQAFDGPGAQGDQDYHMQTGQPLVDYNNEMQAVPSMTEQPMEEFMVDYTDQFSGQDRVPSQNDEFYEAGTGEEVENDYYDEGSNVDVQLECEYEEEEDEQQEYVEDDFVEDDIDTTDPGSWHPQTDPERSRRSLSPDRSMSPVRKNNIQSEESEEVFSPRGDTEDISSVSDMSQQEIYSRDSEPRSDIPPSDSEASEETQSLRSATSETGSQSPRIGARGIPRPSSGLKKSRMKKPLELPPWNDNVVIPKPPRMKPTMIGKQGDLPPPPPLSPHRSKTAQAQYSRKDASSDSGVEEDRTAKSPRKSSADIKKKYGTDSNNPKYKPGGGDIKVFTQKVDTKSVKPRTDSSTPKSTLTPTRVKSPTIPKGPTLNTHNVQSKIGSLNNVRHCPGGGNVTVLSNKADFSNVSSKVGSKDKIHHKPKGGDKKIETKKLNWQTESKVGSMKNAEHSPGGGNVKELGPLDVEGTMNTRENINYKPGGGNVPDPYEEDLDWDADAKVNSLDNVDYMPGGGKVKIFSEKLHWNAVAKVDTALHKKNECSSFRKDHSPSRYDSSKQQVSVTIESMPDETVNEQFSVASAASNCNQSVPMATDHESSHVATDEIDANNLPPPKPPRCIHKQWEKELDGEFDKTDAVKTLGEFDRRVDDMEMMTETRYPLQNIDRYFINGGEENQSYPAGYRSSPDTESRDLEVLTISKEELDKVMPSSLDKIGKEVEDNNSVDKRANGGTIGDKLEPEERVVADITNYEAELRNKSVDRKEVTQMRDLPTIIVMGKENIEEIDNSEKMKTKKKSGFVGKIKDMITSKKKGAFNISDDKKGDSRFSSTSKVVHRTNSRSNKDIKKMPKEIINKEKLRPQDGQDAEIKTMVKYLGYASPKLTKKGKAEKKDESNKNKTKNDVKKLKAKKSDSVEKVANLGYISPKLAKKSDNIILTGARYSDGDDALHKDQNGHISRNNSQRSNKSEKIANLGYQRPKIGVKNVDLLNGNDANDRTSLLRNNNCMTAELSRGVNSEYQEVDFFAKGSETKSCRTVDHGNEGLINPGFYYDIDKATSESDDDEIKVSYAELRINQNQAKKPDNLAPIQITTFKYQRPESPINEVKQELIDIPKQSRGWKSSEDIRDEFLKKEVGCSINRDVSPMRDSIGYALVEKNRQGKLSIGQESLSAGIGLANGKTKNIVEKEKETRVSYITERRDHNELYGIITKAKKTNKGCDGIKEKTDSAKEFDRLPVNLSAIDANTIVKMKNKKTQESHQSNNEDDKELTLDEELKAVLAGIQDSDKRFLKTPSQTDGTETGSRPGTPKISVKPIRLKPEEDARGINYSHSFSVKRFKSTEDLASPSRFDRAQRCQSMIVRNGPSGKLALQSGLGSGKAVSNLQRDEDNLVEASIHGLQRWTRSSNDLSSGDQINTNTAKGCGAKDEYSIGSLQHQASKGAKKGNGSDSCKLNALAVSQGVLENENNSNNEFSAVPYWTNDDGVLELDKAELACFDMFEKSTEPALVKVGEVSGESEMDMTMSFIPGESDSDAEHVDVAEQDVNADMVTTQRLSWSAKSRVGSLDNATHSPGGGKVKIRSERVNWKACAQVGSFNNSGYSPGGGKVKILNEKVEYKAQSKVGSTANLKHKPGGGDKKIETQKLEFKDSAKPKVGSMDKVKHKPGGGDIKVYNESLEWKAESKVQSLKNVKYVPGGGDLKVVDEKLAWSAASRVDSLVNASHVPGGGKVKVPNEKLEWHAKARVHSMDNVQHQPAGGKIKILDEKVDFSQTAASKVGSMDKMKHQPGGGDKKIETQKLNFKESAKPRTNTGVGSGGRRTSYDSQHSHSESVTSQDDSVQG